jgi:hypothetical protein
MRLWNAPLEISLRGGVPQATFNEVTIRSGDNQIANVTAAFNKKLANGCVVFEQGTNLAKELGVTITGSSTIHINYSVYDGRVSKLSVIPLEVSPEGLLTKEIVFEGLCAILLMVR